MHITMPPCEQRRRPTRCASARTALVLAALAMAMLALGLDALPAAASRGAARERSPYPALRPAFTLTRSQLARARAAAAHKPAKKTKKKPRLTGNPARALLAYEAMQTRYYLRGSGLYAGEPFSYLWPFSQAMAATISLANVPQLAKIAAKDLSSRMVGLNEYLDTDNSGEPEGTYTSQLPAFDGTVAPPSGPGGPKYYDDNDWVGIELIRLYKLTHNASVLGSAEGIMAFEMAGWSTNPALGCPGGIPFSNTVENNQRNTVTNAPAAELALQLYGLTHNAEYLQFALKAYTWVRTCLLLPSGLYGDHVGRQGVVEPATWSYNQGTMIGAGAMLYQATGNSEYLYQARQTAAASLAYFTPERLGAENPFFPAVYFRNLMYLDSITHDPPGRKLAQSYVDNAWQNLRLSGNVFVAGSPASAQLLYQAVVVQLYAMLSSSPSTYF